VQIRRRQRLPLVPVPNKAAKLARILDKSAAGRRTSICELTDDQVPTAAQKPECPREDGPDLSHALLVRYASLETERRAINPSQPFIERRNIRVAENDGASCQVFQ
jgi:hypothetical protein